MNLCIKYYIKFHDTKLTASEKAFNLGNEVNLFTSPSSSFILISFSGFFREFSKIERWPLRIIKHYKKKEGGGEKKKGLNHPFFEWRNWKYFLKYPTLVSLPPSPLSLPPWRIKAILKRRKLFYKSLSTACELKLIY